MRAITYRLKGLQIISGPLFKKLFDYFGEKGWRKPPYPEPGANPAERPERFRRLCFRAVAESAVSESKAAELLGVSVRQLDRMLEQPA